MITIKPTDPAGTYREEIDNTKASSLGAGVMNVALVGLFEQGPTNRRFTLNDTGDRLRLFGKSDITKYGASTYAVDSHIAEDVSVLVVRATSGNSGKYSSLVLSPSGGTLTATPAPELGIADVLSAPELPEGKGNTSRFILPLERMALTSNAVSIFATQPSTKGNDIGVRITGYRENVRVKPDTSIITYSARPATTAVAIGDIVWANSRAYLCVVAGTTGASDPSGWATASGSVVDGTATWVASANSVITSILSNKVVSWTASTAVAVGTILLDETNTTSTKKVVYRCTTAGTTASAKPAGLASTANLATITDGTAVWTRDDGFYAPNLVFGGFLSFTYNSESFLFRVVGLNNLNDHAFDFGNFLDTTATKNFSKVGVGVTIDTANFGSSGGSVVLKRVISTTAEFDTLNLKDRYPDDTLYKRLAYVEIFKKSKSTDTTYPASPEDAYLVSFNDENTPQGELLYAPDVVNGRGKELIYIKQNLSAQVTDSGNFDTFGSIVALSGGEDVTDTISNALGYVAQAVELFRSREYSKYRVFSNPYGPQDGDTAFQIAKAWNSVVSSRILGFGCSNVDKVTDLTTDSIIQRAEGAFSGLVIPSRSVYFAGFDRIVDPNSGKRVFVPKSITGVNAIIRATKFANEAKSPTGEYGIGLGYEQNIHFTKKMVGILKSKNINAGWDNDGSNQLWAQMTAQRTPSARDRINVRNVLDFVGEDLEKVGDSFVWETIISDLLTRINSTFQKKGEFYRDKKKIVNNFRFSVDSSRYAENRVDVKFEVQPARTLEYFGISIVATDEGFTITEL